MISSSKLSPKGILGYTPDSSDIAERFVAAKETRNRVDAPLMMQTVKLLTDAVEAHQQMQYQINTDIVDTGTSWTTALSKLLASLGDMMRGHITASISLLSILNDVYLNHVKFLVTGLVTQLQECDGMVAEVHVIIIRAQLKISSTEADLLQLLRNKLKYLGLTLSDFKHALDAEACKSSYQWHYFPNPLRIGDCALAFRNVDDSLSDQIQSLSSLIPTAETAVPPGQATEFPNMTQLGSDMTNLSVCLMSYKTKLKSFEDQLNSILTTTLKADFNYEPPTTSLRQFNIDSQWLDSIARQYIASSESKLYVATALHTNGSEVLTNADRLYSDIDQSLFSKVSNVIDEQETGMVSFYSGLLQRVTTLQRYLFPNDTALEEFMRSLSIWRSPIVNFQKSQVLLLPTPTMSVGVGRIFESVCLSVCPHHNSKTNDSKAFKFGIGNDLGIP